MSLEILPLEEGTRMDINGRFYRFKRGRFQVNKAEHVIEISMDDFNAGRSAEIIEKEAAKIDISTPKSKKS